MWTISFNQGTKVPNEKKVFFGRTIHMRPKMFYGGWGEK